MDVRELDQPDACWHVGADYGRSICIAEVMNFAKAEHCRGAMGSGLGVEQLDSQTRDQARLNQQKCSITQPTIVTVENQLNWYLPAFRCVACLSFHEYMMLIVIFIPNVHLHRQTCFCTMAQSESSLTLSCTEWLLCRC